LLERAELLRIVRAKLNYVPKDFSGIGRTFRPGLVARRGFNANSNANAQEIVFFQGKSFSHGAADRRRGWPRRSPWRGSQRTNSETKTDPHTEIKVFAISAKVACTVSDAVDSSKVADAGKYRDTSEHAVAQQRDFP
jgi:hypothetical protein